jgi:Tol biopolymer transport system component
MGMKRNISLGAAIYSFLILLSANVVSAQTVARIAFDNYISVNHKAGHYQIFSMNPDGSDVVQLTTGTNESILPSWSPGQQYIAFARSDDRVVIMPAAGEANGGQIFTVGPASPLSRAGWSPDGSRLVYLGAGNLYTVSVDTLSGMAGTPIIFTPGEYYDPSWSPDGTRIVAAGSVDGNTSLITVFDATTGDVLSSFGADDNVNNLAPQWRPDGALIAFQGDAITKTTSKGGRTTTTTYSEIFLANPDGTDVTRLTYLDNITAFPAWSPDSASLAFRSYISGTSSIYTMPVGGTTVTLLHAGNSPDWNP